MKKNLSKLSVALLSCAMMACQQATQVNTEHKNTTEMEKQDIGNPIALYPKPLTVVGAEVDGKVNWLVVGHTGIIGHEHILVSMSKSHYTNRGVKQTKKLSINLLSREMLPKAEYVGSVSGEDADKSEVFAYHWGQNGTPVIDDAPVSMECDVVDTYELNGFENFICTVAHTYAAPEYLDGEGHLDYTRLKPVLFEGRSNNYLATGEVIGQVMNSEKQPVICTKQPLQADGIVRLSKIEVLPQYIDEYIRMAAEVGEISLRTEPGVLTMYAVQEKENPGKVTILETYASQEAYEKHIASEHFRKYKQETKHMVKSLVLSDQTPLNPAARVHNFIQ